MLPTRQGHDCLSPGLPTHVFLDRIRDCQRWRRTRCRIPLVAVLPIQRPWLAPLCTCHSRVSPQQWVQHIPILRAVYCVALVIQRPKGAKVPLPARLCLSLSVDHDVADLLAEEVQLVFSRGRVPSFFDIPRQRGRSGAHRGHAQDSLAHYKSCRAVVGSGSVGPASQAVVVPALCGLDDPVSFIRSEVGAFKFHLGGFARFLEEAGVHGTDRHCVQGERQRFAMIVERSARPCPVQRNLESCIRTASLGGVFGRQ